MFLEEILIREKPQQAMKTAAKKLLGCQCVYCGNEFDELTADHIKPRSRGGQTVHWNLAGACLECNRSKGSADVWEWWRRSYHWHDAVLEGRDKKLLSISFCR